MAEGAVLGTHSTRSKTERPQLRGYPRRAARRWSCLALGCQPRGVSRPGSFLQDLWRIFGPLLPYVLLVVADRRLRWRPKAKRTCPCETVWSLFTCILAPIPATVAWLFAQSGWGFNGGRRSSKPMVTPPLGSSFQARSVIKSPASGVSSYSLVLPHGFWSFGEMLGVVPGNLALVLFGVFASSLAYFLLYFNRCSPLHSAL